MSSILAVIRLNFFKVFGLIPNDLKDKNLKLSGVSVLITFVFLVLYTGGIFYCFAVPYHSGFVNVLSSTANTLILLVDLVAVIVLLLSRITKSQLLQELCVSFGRIHHMLAAGNDGIVKSIRRKADLAIFLTIILVAYVNLFTFCVLYLDYQSTSIWYRLISMISKIIFAVAMCFAYCILSALLSLWKKVIELLKTKKNSCQVNFIKPLDVTALIELHQELYQATKAAEKYLGIIFLSVFSASFTSITVLLYFSYSAVKIILDKPTGTVLSVVQVGIKPEEDYKKMWTSETVMVFVSSIIFYVLIVAVITLVCEGIVEKAKVADELVHRISFESQRDGSSQVNYSLDLVFGAPVQGLRRL